MLKKRCCSERNTLALVLFSLCMLGNHAFAQGIPPSAIPLHDPALAGGEMARLGKRLYVSPSGLTAGQNAVRGQITLPRMAASLVGLQWLGHKLDDSLKLKVEQDHWILSWSDRPPAATAIVLSFDAAPRLLSEVKPVRATGDGSIYLPACLATTSGEKIRYEPQTFKNTVGYWVGKHDFASWDFVTTAAGVYNVSILQGCGSGQGGSAARLSIDGSGSVRSLEFEVLETGHFQNFHWRHVGTIELENAGEHSLKIEPVAIKKAALMDVRAVHLVRLPN